MNYKAFFVGLFAFLLVGAFHPLVVAFEYHVGKEKRGILVVVGLLALLISFFCKAWVAIILGVLGAACLWSAYEVKKQYHRVCKGQAKPNPKRPTSYYKHLGQNHTSVS